MAAEQREAARRTRVYCALIHVGCEGYEERRCENLRKVELRIVSFMRPDRTLPEGITALRRQLIEVLCEIRTLWVVSAMEQIDFAGKC